MRFPAMVLAFAAALVARPEPARACSCMRPGLEVLPGKGTAAPLNTRVRIVLPDGDWLAQAGGTVDGLRAAIRVKNDKKAKPVEFDRRQVGSGVVYVIELTPKKPLAAKTTYQVLLAAKDGKDEVAGEFTTGDTSDGDKPVWDGLQRATYVKQDAVCCNCTTGDPFAVLETRAATDASHVVYGVWAVAANETIDWSKDPITYLAAHDGKLVAGHDSQCSPANFTFPAGVDKLLIGVRAFDLAGNASETAAEVILDLAAPSKTRPK